MTKEWKQQFTLRITQANSTELVVILYEMLLCYLDEAEEALKAGNTAEAGDVVKTGDAAEAGDADEFRNAVRKARGCLNELLRSLHLKYEPAPTLQQLYLFCIRRLAHAEVKRENSALEEIRKVIRPLHDAYEQIAGQNTQGPVMDNSQAVYAGLTYGRNTLTENMADQGANRGMLV